MASRVDLNADVGEECGDDAALLAIVTTANVASGEHAGGGAVMESTVGTAISLGVAVGAHPSYADRAAFGRVSHAHRLSPRQIARLVRSQVIEVAVVADLNGSRLSHVKAHGALYHDAATQQDVADAVIDGVRSACVELGYDRLPVMGQAGTRVHAAALSADVVFVAEGFADRRYLPDGRLAPRSHPEAVLGSLDAITKQVLQVVLDGRVTAIDGTVLRMPVDTICVHGDTPGAVAIARAVRLSLEGEGVVVTRWANEP